MKLKIIVASYAVATASFLALAIAALLAGCAGGPPLTDQERAYRRAVIAAGIEQGFDDMARSIDDHRPSVPQTTTVIGNTVWGAHSGVVIPDGQGGGTFWGD